MANACKMHIKQRQRTIAQRQGISQSKAWRILKENSLHPYHFQKVQALDRNDFQARREFCTWLQGQTAQNPEFLRNILWTDECCFTRSGILNTRNSYIWSDENPHAVLRFNFQRRWSVNLRAGVYGDRLIGPYLFPQNLNGDRYLHFIENTLFEELPLAMIRDMWYVHDGAPAHFARPVRGFLDNNCKTICKIES